MSSNQKILHQLQNVTLQYPRLAEPDPENGKYSVQMINISKEDAKVLEEAGVEIPHGKDRKVDGEPKPTPEWGLYKTGRTQFEFDLYDGTGTNITGKDKDALLKMVGTGTVANVDIKTNPYTKPKKGVSCYIRGIQIVKLVTDSGACNFKAVEDGYEHPKGEAVAEDNMPY